MRSSSAQNPRFPAAVLGSLILLELLAARLLFSANPDRVYFLGHALNMECWFQRSFGIPCPACGGSRAFILAVHGFVLEAWRLNPLGPLAVAGMLALGVGLLFIATVDRRPWLLTAPTIAQKLRTAAVAYVAAGTAIWIVSWVHTVLKMTT
jgi:hypothetical protein